MGYPSGGSWSSSNTSVMTVANSGLINLLNTGIAVLTYTYTNSNGCAASRSITGNIVSCASRGLAFNSALDNTNMKVYPNPAKDIVNVECVNAKELMIIDCLGRIVYNSMVYDSLVKVNVKQFNKGIYLVKVVLKNGEIIVEKMIIE